MSDRSFAPGRILIYLVVALFAAAFSRRWSWSC